MILSKWGFAVSTALALVGIDAGLTSVRPCHAAEAAHKAAPDIVMYATATCGYCKKARAYFTAHHVAWREVDIDGSDAAKRDWEAKQGMGTPLILIDGQRIEGFVQAKLDAALAAYPSTAD